MLRIKRILTQSPKGMTLIELMIAVFILALVAMGLFRGFTVAFQAMADAKDRTMATNYAQQMLEEYKNMHFEEIGPKAYPNMDKFSRNVGVPESEDDDFLKKVIAIVTWKDSNNIDKEIVIETLVSNALREIDSEEGGPDRLVLSADKVNLLPGTDGRSVPAHIFAKIFDKYGNLVTDWNEGKSVFFEIVSMVNFQEEETDLGSLRSGVATFTNGMADTYFDQATDEEREGFVTIKASTEDRDGNEINSTLTLKITTGAVAIELSSDKDIISTKEGENIAHITARIIDAAGDLVETVREVRFVLSGNTDPRLINYTAPGSGITEVDLKAGSITGISTITAIAELLDPVSIEIEVVDPSISRLRIEAEEDTIAQADSTIITATLTDYLGEPIEGEIIDFHTDFGNLEILNGGRTDAGGKVSAVLTMNYSGTATVQASWTDVEGNEIAATVQVECRNHFLYIWVEPDVITEGGEATIYAELTNYKNDPLESENIIFTIKEGSGAVLEPSSSSTGEDGLTNVKLTINSPGYVTVLAYWSRDSDGVYDEEEVECTLEPIYGIELIPQNKDILEDEQPLTLTASVTQDGEPVGSGIGVTFTVVQGSPNAQLNYSSPPVTIMTDDNGTASVELSGLEPGDTVILKAESGGAWDSSTITCALPGASYPVVESHATSYIKEKRNHRVSLPSGIEEGDLLIVLFYCEKEGNPQNFVINGWTRAGYNQYSSHNCAIFYKTAVGNEGNQVIVDTNNNKNKDSSHISLRISNWSNSALSGGNNGANQNPDPPNLEHGWGIYKTLYIAVAGGDGNRTVASYPSGYSEIIQESVGKCWVACAEKEEESAGDNPLTFNISSGGGWTAWTMAVKGK